MLHAIPHLLLHDATNVFNCKRIYQKDIAIDQGRIQLG